MKQGLNNTYYVYVYLDPRKRGMYKYDKYELEFEPFYVGKGKGNRYKSHLITKKHYNNFFYNKINKIRKETGNNPIIKIIENNLEEKQAFLLEKKLIKDIGKKYLCNITVGGEGVSEWAKGKTYEEMYGKAVASKIKILRVRSLIKNRKNIKISNSKNEKHSIYMKNNNPMKLYNIDFSGKNNPNAKEYLITSPEGKVHYVRCLKDFCKLHNLLTRPLSALASGKRTKLYRGWNCKYATKQGLIQINIEISSLCNKNCWCCGRREREKKYGFQNYGFINFKLLQKIARQIPLGIIVVLHNSGEPTMYPRLKEAIDLFKKNNNIVQFNTNGKLILEKAHEIINHLDSLCFSIIENDEDSDEQYEKIKKFLELKKESKPLVVFRLLGDVCKYYLNKKYYYNLNRLLRIKELAKKYNCIICQRTLHLPKGSIKYNKEVVVPEAGICLDLLTHLSIDRFGYISPCVRYDPEGELILGNIKEMSLLEAWNSQKRRNIIEKFLNGKRCEIPYCGNKCEYWGIPKG